MTFQKRYENSGLICPVTGSYLIYTGCDLGTMDGPSYYESFIDSSVKYELWPRCKHYFLLGTNRSFLIENGNWEEYITIKGEEFHISASKEEIDYFFEKKEREAKIREEIYEKKVASGEIVPLPLARHIFPKLIASEIVQIKPMSAPTGMLYYLDIKRLKWYQRIWKLLSNKQNRRNASLLKN